MGCYSNWPLGEFITNINRNGNSLIVEERHFIFVPSTVEEQILRFVFVPSIVEEQILRFVFVPSIVEEQILWFVLVPLIG